jgi:thioredoxin-like negative regulator of GroEL
MINVTQNPQVVAMSKETICEIKYVPYIVLYFNGKPYIRYDGPYDAGEVAQFVVEITNKLHSKEKFMESETIKLQEKSIPAYCIGTPISDRVSYLNFMDAYKKT